MKNIIITFLLASMAIGCIPSNVPQQYYSDSSITSAIKEALVLNNLFSKDMYVSTSNGNVTLSGFGCAEKERLHVIRIIKRVNGVKSFNIFCHCLNSEMNNTD